MISPPTTLALGLIAFLLVLLAGPATRKGLSFKIGLLLLAAGTCLGVAIAVLALVQLYPDPPPLQRDIAFLLTASALGGLAAGPFFSIGRGLTRPAIHDITTDVVDPPAFAAVLPHRTRAVNSVTHGGPKLAERQQRAYPDIQPLRVAMSPDVAFMHAVTAARQMHWEIVATDADAGRIEATATTRWFGFKDDIVVRVQPDGAGARIDVRSLSRVGTSDFGVNASRIRAYLALLARP